MSSGGSSGGSGDFKRKKTGRRGKRVMKEKAAEEEAGEASMSPVLIVMEDSEDERSESLSWGDSAPLQKPTRGLTAQLPLQRVSKNSDETQEDRFDKGKRTLHEGAPPPRTAMELLDTRFGSTEEPQEENWPSGAEERTLSQLLDF